MFILKCILELSELSYWQRPFVFWSYFLHNFIFIEFTIFLNMYQCVKICYILSGWWFSVAVIILNFNWKPTLTVRIEMKPLKCHDLSFCLLFSYESWNIWRVIFLQDYMHKYTIYIHKHIHRYNIYIYIYVYIINTHTHIHTHTHVCMSVCVCVCVCVSCILYGL